MIVLDYNKDTNFNILPVNIVQGGVQLIKIINLPINSHISDWSWKNTAQPIAYPQDWGSSTVIQEDSGNGSINSVVFNPLWDNNNATTRFATITVPLPMAIPEFGVGKSYSFIWQQNGIQPNIVLTTTETNPEGGAGQLISVRNVFNVKDFGAIGDGVIDDTVAIQEAYNSAGLAGGGQVYFPRGVYRLTDAVLIQYNNITSTGESQNLSIIAPDFVGGEGGKQIGALIVAQTSTSIENITFEKLGFHLNNQATVAIYVRTAIIGDPLTQNINFKNLDISNFGCDSSGAIGSITIKAKYLDALAEINNITFSGCLFRDNQPITNEKRYCPDILFLSDGASDILIKDNQFINTYGGNIAFVQSPTSFRNIKRVKIVHNRFYQNQTINPTTGEIFNQGSINENRQGFDGILIADNHFEPNNYDPIAQTKTADYYVMLIYNSLNFVVTGNIFKRSTGIIAPGHSYPTGNETCGFIFANNTIFECFEFGDIDGHYNSIYNGNLFYKLARGQILGQYGRKTPSIYTNNLFYNCGFDPDTSVEYAQGIFLIQSGGQIISNNQIYFSPEVSPPATPPVATPSVNSGNLNGTYSYKMTFVTSEGETIGTSASNEITATNQQVNLSIIPSGTAYIISRRIYRTENGGTVYKLVGETFNAESLTFVDNVADENLGEEIPTTNTTGRQVKYIFCELSDGGGYLEEPVVYQNNTINGTLPSTKTFYLDSGIKHVIKGNIGVLEDEIKLSTNLGNPQIASMPNSDVVIDNFMANGTPTQNGYKFNLATYTDNNSALAGGLGIGQSYKTPTGEIRIVI